MNVKEVQEQLQEDLISIVEGYGVAIVSYEETEKLKTLLCQAVIDNLKKLKQ